MEGREKAAKMGEGYGWVGQVTPGRWAAGGDWGATARVVTQNLESRPEILQREKNVKSDVKKLNLEA